MAVTMTEPIAPPEAGHTAQYQILRHDRSTGGGASLSAICEFLSIWEAFFLVQPVARACSLAALACLRETGRNFCISPGDLVTLKCMVKLCRPCGRDRGESEITYVRRLLQALPARVAVLSLPFGVPDMELRSWVQSGLLQEVEELHLLGHGGPSDVGFARLASRCPKLRRLTLLGGGVSVAAVLVLHAEVSGALSPEWWRTATAARLRILPRLQGAVQRELTVQRVPSWLVGQWSPITPGWGHEVQHFDALGRFVFLRNGMIERVGVVRSCLPSPYGLWWELDLCFFVHQEWVNQTNLMLPVGPPSEPALGLHTWANGEEEPPGKVKVAVVGSTENVRQHPRQFPHHSLNVAEWHRWSREEILEAVFPWSRQEWVEAAVASCNGDVSMVFDRADTESEDEEDLGTAAVPSMEEVLAKLDWDEAMDLLYDRPSMRMEVQGQTPSVEEFLAQLDREDAEEVGSIDIVA